MKYKEGFGISTLLMCFIGGAAIGGAVGLLTAPDDGVATRRRLLKAARRSRDQLARVPEKIKSGATEIAHSAGDIAHTVGDSVKSVVTDAYAQTRRS